ncbi:hypothetical protein Nepgr_017221 [Nepenthes gracilis]|uniref:Uncharacterized protein n=1 Tax=Nepenthes gracilis TaxID=150966 RepID=A0AAD3SP23_NEPGR|nr:hypothetical protein Nepgr_017221 [Nepenthes gracilis]
MPLKDEVSEKIWSRKEPSYDHLQVFGSKVFVHISKDERTKDVTIVEDEMIKDIDKKNKVDVGRTDKISVEIICLIPIQYEDNGPEMVKDNNEIIMALDEDQDEAAPDEEVSKMILEQTVILRLLSSE